MTELTAVRTLVKSAPELWAICSDVEMLAQHLEAFGEIRITRLEPETTVAWEGERATGTVSIEPAGWGTKVTMTATTPGAAEDRSVAEDQRVAWRESVAEEVRFVEEEQIAEEDPAVAQEPAKLERS